MAAQAAVATDQAALTFSQQQSGRYVSLAHIGAGTTQESQQWQADIREKEAALAHDTAEVGVAQKQIDIFGSALNQARATLAQRQALQRQAELNLSYTIITAPADGTVGDRTLRVGQYVQAGTALMAVVPLSAVYVTANYKETQLTGVQPGQPVTIDVDMFPDATVHGVVNSIAPASGEEFALLPPDNATTTPQGIQSLRTRVKALPKTTFIVLYCGCCPWNHCPNVRPAYNELHKMGFSDVKVLYIADNLGADWVDKGYPTIRGQ